jgi:hypothetical protein
MSISKRIKLSILLFLGFVMYLIPNLSAIVSMCVFYVLALLHTYGQYTAGILMMFLVWHTAKICEHYYRKHKEKESGQ